jgi:hypothetical protein
LGNSSSSRGDSGHIEFTQLVIIFNHGSFSFENRNGNGRLVILISGKSLRFFGGDEGSFIDNFGHDSSNGFNSESKRGSINNNQRFSFFRSISTDNSSLDGSSVSNSFIRVNSGIGFFSIEEIFDELSNFRDSGRSSDKNDFIDLVFGES